MLFLIQLIGWDGPEHLDDLVPNLNACVYSPEDWVFLIAAHDTLTLPCLYLPDEHIWKEARPEWKNSFLRWGLSLKKLVRGVMKERGKTWDKAKKLCFKAVQLESRLVFQQQQTKREEEERGVTGEEDRLNKEKEKEVKKGEEVKEKEGERLKKELRRVEEEQLNRHEEEDAEGRKKTAHLLKKRDAKVKLMQKNIVHGIRYDLFLLKSLHPEYPDSISFFLWSFEDT